MQRVRTHSRTTRRPERSGSVTLEFILVFPIIFIASLAIAEFAFLSLMIEGATTALHEGTREGAEAYPAAFPLDLAGADNDIADKIIEVINNHLNVYNLEVADPANGFSDTPGKQNATVVIQYDGMMAFTRPAAGGLPCVPALPAAAAGEIVVSLCFEIVDSTDPTGINGPVPDWLATFGFTLSGTTFEMTTRQSLE